MSVVLAFVVHAPGLILPALTFATCAMITLVSRLVLYRELRNRMGPLHLGLWYMPLYLEVAYLRNRPSIGSRRLDRLTLVAALGPIAWVVSALWLGMALDGA